jgi:hypothetical protein
MDGCIKNTKLTGIQRLKDKKSLSLKRKGGFLSYKTMNSEIFFSK